MMQSTQGKQCPGANGNSARLAWLGVLGGAMMLAACVMSPQPIDHVARAPAPMKGETLSALHASIPASQAPEELPPTF